MKTAEHLNGRRVETQWARGQKRRFALKLTVGNDKDDGIWRLFCEWRKICGETDMASIDEEASEH